ncbi:hypothetical protein J3R75_001214 [Oligosphaera ethanolica]|uniref:Uncharacterized protein n=1 Tax=Oligosphaera ethanolica TaxID=760260 RepID=A0AAE4AP89_9BACT|nr:hypothetical protein [Oligosphaera ethanolica]
MSPPPASSNSSPEQVRAAVPAAWSLAKLGCGRARIVAPPISVMCRWRPPSDYHAAPRRFWRGRLARTLAEACASLDHRTVMRVIRLWCGRLARTLAEACASLDHRTVMRVIRLWCGRLARTLAAASASLDHRTVTRVIRLWCGRLARTLAEASASLDHRTVTRVIRLWCGRLARTLAEASASLDHRTVTRVIRLWCGRLARTGACGLLPDKAPGSSMDSMDAMDIIPRRRPGGMAFILGPPPSRRQSAWDRRRPGGNLPGSAAVPAAWPSSWDRRRPGGLAILAAQFISSLERWITTRKCPRLVLTTDQTGAFVHRWQLVVLSDGPSASSGLFPSCRPLCPHP